MRQFLVLASFLMGVPAFSAAPNSLEKAGCKPMIKNGQVKEYLCPQISATSNPLSGVAKELKVDTDLGLTHGPQTPEAEDKTAQGPAATDTSKGTEAESL